MTYNTINDAMTMRTGGGPALGRIDQYELVRELGGGGFGAVYLAKDTVSGIEVAVKGLPPLVRNNREELENVRRNFALVSRLTHENIAKALVLHPAKEVCYFDRRAEELLRVASGDTLMVMDFAPGSTLSEWRKQFDGGIVPLEKAARLLEQIASALDYAHEHKIVHRDIKPANVMVETSVDGVLTARVLDFGLAAEIRSSMSRVSMQIMDTSGTRPYMAPEQWAGRRQGPATDQYALAVLACELLVGEVPFKSAFDTGDPMVMMNAVVSNEPEFPDEVPSAVAKALKKALAKDPGDRFATCRDFVAALCGRRVKWRRSGGGRHVPAKVLLAASLAVLVAAGGWWTWHTLEERRRAEAAALKAAAVELQERARIAHEDADRRGFAEVPELARMHREFERFYRSGMRSFDDGDFASATNFFCKVGVCMREMFAEARKIDETEAKRNADRDRRLRLAEVDRKVSLGYQRRKGADGEDEAVWVEGVKHPSAAHWISGKRVGEWTAEPGYEPLSGRSGALSALAWKPGLVYGDFKSSEEEGVWLRKVKCGACGGGRTTAKTDICASCGGARRRTVSHVCSSCSGSGSVFSRSQCGICGGSGSKTTVCSRCGGSGRLKCGGCKGSGKVANVGGMIASGIVSAFSKTRSYATSPQAKIPCGRCSGTGFFVCESCSGGGMKRASCASCRGACSVSSRRSCAACGGSGKVSATEACSACAGAGTVRRACDCAECGGTGFLWQQSGFEEVKSRLSPYTFFKVDN